jgi:hypothetical protein
MRRRCDPLDIDDVLERVGHAVKRSAPTTGGDLGLNRPRRRECSLRRQCDEGVEFWVVALDPCQQRRRVLDRRQFLVADQLGSFGEAEYARSPLMVRASSPDRRAPAPVSGACRAAGASGGAPCRPSPARIARGVRRSDDRARVRGSFREVGRSSDAGTSSSFPSGRSRWRRLGD